MAVLSICIEGDMDKGVPNYNFDRVEYHTVPRVGEEILIDDQFALFRLEVIRVCHSVRDNAGVAVIYTEKIDMIEYNPDYESGEWNG